MTKAPHIFSAALLTGVVVIGAGAWWKMSLNKPKTYASANLVLPSVVSPRTVLPESEKVVQSQSQGTIEFYQAQPSDRMGYILGALGDGTYSTRHAAIKLLGTKLSKKEVETLFEFLSEPNNLSQLEPLAAAALKNEVMNVLRNQEVPPAGLAQILIGMFHNMNQPSVMRDYALQHMARWYQDGAAVEEKAQIWEALMQGSNGHTGSMPGTSLLAMLRVTNIDAGQQQELHRAALQQVQSPGSDPLAMATALQVCSQLQIKEAYPIALHLAQSKQTSIPLKISAIAAIGDLGGARDRVLLENWANGSELRLRLPASSALQRMNKRLSL